MSKIFHSRRAFCNLELLSRGFSWNQVESSSEMMFVVGRLLVVAFFRKKIAWDPRVVQISTRMISTCPSFFPLSFDVVCLKDVGEALILMSNNCFCCLMSSLMMIDVICFQAVVFWMVFLNPEHWPRIQEAHQNYLDHPGHHLVPSIKIGNP